MSNKMILEKYSFGVGDRFGHQGKAQLQAMINAKKQGISITPVWNKSNREHSIIHTAPADVRREADKYVLERLKMVRDQIRSRGINDPAVLDAMSEIPREEFIPETYRFQAYADGPVPIGLGQTISQPYIVALMTQSLQVNNKCDVLELGTGSGYQTAILAKIARKVYTIERHAQLSEAAQAVLGRLGITNVEFYVGDGTCGWPEPRMFERIIITAAAPEPPKPLLEQLADSGLMVIPIGDRYAQQLMSCQKKGGTLHNSFICDCRFVPLTGKYGFTELSK